MARTTTFITFHKSSGELVSIHRSGAWSDEAIIALVKKQSGVGTVKVSAQDLWKMREWVNIRRREIRLPATLSELHLRAATSAEKWGLTVAEFFAFRRANRAAQQEKKVK